MQTIDKIRDVNPIRIAFSTDNRKCNKGEKTTKEERKVQSTKLQTLIDASSIKTIKTEDEKVKNSQIE